MKSVINLDFHQCEWCHATAIVKSNGYYVCRACGLVQSDLVLHNEHPIHQDRNGVIIPSSAPFNGGLTRVGYSSTSNSAQISRLRRMQYFCDSDYRLHLYTWFMRLQKYFNIELSMHLIQSTANRIFPKLQKGSKAKSMRLFASTLFYLLCKKYCIVIKLSKILEFADISNPDYFKCLKAIRAIDKTVFIIDSDSLLRYIKTIVSRISHRLKTPERFIPIINYLLLHFRPYLGEKPEIIAASAICIGYKTFNHKVSVLDVAQVAEVTPSTVYGHLNKFPIAKFRKFWHSKTLARDSSFPKSHVQILYQ